MTKNPSPLFRQALGSNVAVLGLNFANVALTSLFAGLSTRGAITAIMAYPPLLASICCFGLHLGFVYLTQQFPDRVQNLFRCLIMYAIFSVGTGTLLSLAISPYIASKISVDRTLVSIWTVVLTDSTIVYALFSGACQTEKLFHVFSFSRLMSPLLTAAVILIFGIFSVVETRAYLAAYVAGSIVSSALTIVACIKEYKNRGVLAQKDVRELGRLASLYWIGDVMNILVWQVDKIVLIALSMSMREVGIYTVVAAIARGVGQIPISLSQVLLAKAIGKSRQQVVEQTAVNFRYITVLSVLMASCLTPVMLSSFFIRNTGISQFVQVLCILSMDSCVAGGSLIVSQAFSAVGEPHKGAIRQLVGGLSAILFAYLFGMRLGVVGVAIGIFMSSLLKLIVAWLMFKNAFETRSENWIPSRTDWGWALDFIKRGG
ncbi:lipopolysaccharide biosynthesis protein [Paraburkholderia terricola]|uniref:lipopolysaccharide biosynthesis protein n=1 Tax=Paraburkholderia terricola TaxID=169427 RepID=UPI003ECC8543